MNMNMTNRYGGDGVGDETAFWQKTYLHGQRRNHGSKVCVNRANEIVTFKRAYGFGEPIQYI